ncbi:hypothetical protein TSUD_59230 [Trifolium subterraneum]|uniref:Uncharacterized protein n=1 Tax=Trifolium subterraneum TaxID=3900 RepID=A0A2Z6MAQ3_TRISU|nr:hypothetical protein TSUD_59230 [Trifolium subterraneum]
MSSASSTLNISQKLFETPPSPTPTKGLPSKYNITAFEAGDMVSSSSGKIGKIQSSHKRDKTKQGVEFHSNKKGKLSASVIPKGAKLNFRPTSDMSLTPKEAQA